MVRRLLKLAVVVHVLRWAARELASQLRRTP
jgi:hypothetical protein